MGEELTQQVVLAASRYAEERKDLYWRGRFDQYLDIVRNNPEVTRNAFARLYDMIVSYGVKKGLIGKEEVCVYKFFDDPMGNGQDAIFGIKPYLAKLVQTFDSARKRYGTEKRVLLLHGPVGSSKSTIVRLLKKGLERYSRSAAGALYSFAWRKDLYYGSAKKADQFGDEMYVPCPMHEEPLLLIPESVRSQLLKELLGPEVANKIFLEGGLCPACRQVFRRLLEKHGGDFSQVIGGDNIRVYRLLLSEQDRVGIGTFQPKDEKNQDSTELTGDLNYRRLVMFGSDSDARAFNFDGEFQVANRGLIEFIEVLKLDVAFLYDLLGASQEHMVKPKKFAQTRIDEVIIGHTNSPEYHKLQNNEFMEALRDRTVKLDVPYVTVLNEEIKIYEKDFDGHKVKDKHIAPHSLEIAAMWAVLTRLEDPANAGLTLLQKLKLYNGKTLPGYTPDNVEQLRKQAVNEGMTGISPRYVQDQISNALVVNYEAKSLNPFMILRELENGLDSHGLVSGEEQKSRYKELIAIVKEEYTDIVKNEVQKAIAADAEALDRLAGNYIDNVKAYTQKEKVKNEFTGEDEDPNERLMRSVEEKIDIPETRKDDFRRELMNYIGAQAINGKAFDYHDNERLVKALELKLFEDSKDTIKLTQVVSQTEDSETQKKIEIVKQRMIDNFGYDEESATDVLRYVASIFARGDAKEQEEE